MFKVIVAGSRDFNNYLLLRDRLDYYLQNKTDVVIVSGTAKGADTLGEMYAVERGLKIERYPADWSKGKHAGYLRNLKMAENAHALIAFTNGSRGTGHMIDIAKQKGLPVRTVYF